MSLPHAALLPLASLCLWLGAGAQHVRCPAPSAGPLTRAASLLAGEADPPSPRRLMAGTAPAAPELVLRDPPAARAAPQAAEQDAPKAPEVPVRLLASLATVAPQSEFELGVHLDVPEGWHVYWENPGDTGMATSARLELPEGFEVTGPLFPGPMRHEDPGGLVSFVHEGDLVLFFLARSPQELPEGPLRFSARVRWLACRETCFVGSAEPELELETAAQAVPAPAETLRLLRAQRALLPRPLAGIGDEVRVEWLAVPVPPGERERTAFRLELPAVERLEFFEAPRAAFETLRQAHEASGRCSRLAVELAPRPGWAAQPARIQGVVRLEKGAEVTYFTLDQTGPPVPAKDR